MPRLTLALLVIVVGIAGSPREAAAARIPVIYQTGQDAFTCGPLPAPFDQEPELAGFKAAYLCDITGVFWTYFSVRNCKPVAIKGDSYNDNPELVAAIQAKYPESSMTRGVWNHYGWMLMAAVIGLGLILIIKSKLSGDDD
jgi:hypothetical protein